MTESRAAMGSAGESDAIVEARGLQLAYGGRSVLTAVDLWRRIGVLDV